MKFLFRADASLEIGSGHIMRCLTLANVLREQGHSAKFITRAHIGHLADFIEKQGFECILLPSPHPSPPPQAGEGKYGFSGSLKHAAWLGTTQERDFAECEPHILDFQPDWLICDHYALDKTWETLAQNACGAKIAVIDDLHDRPHQAHVLLDQNLGRTATDYANLLPPNCRVLAGTHYALLRPEFAAWRETALSRHPNKQRVLLNLGGVDKDNITLKILAILAQHFSGSLKITVVMGASAPHIASVQHFAQNAPFDCQVIVNAKNMAEIMAQSDWAIGAAGSTSWERCCMALPSLLLILADNQREIAQQLQSFGAAQAFELADLGTPNFIHSLHHFQNFDFLAKMSQQATQILDGFGTKRVVNQLIDLSEQKDITHIRVAQDHDVQRLFDWRNHDTIRQFMFQQEKLVWKNHQNWFIKQLSNPDFKMLIYYVNDVPQGYVSFKKIQENQWEWGFYTAPDCPRGHGTKMGRLALTWAFTELNAYKIEAVVFKENIPSLKMHEKLGFTAALKPVFRQFNTHNCIIFTLFKNQFLF
ncbi:MAG: UDP-2,4-diacetamido-2,4,6-trideoxy-beta-L-altropyranose hydrolase [Alysiella sp.]|uniref:UDP-2,4-diacetamido-2,4, 6-trideoxy-beta-L-altropyranose hydrolase n=1 Tax=Alysiella sp. TaxID=1872483 RepID=UPI0026DDA813|nr:UDP-2,4-diacetamido-2,4,6-trideoxy-beta-L-altropyranose hydrolase [Alysiella sp.]MDO4433885.1 UDP-2,4-diacetamido-2,4,6-trideoxy-beta-L-altropyranose hydrolase [Alysiella sp.]